MFGSCRNLLCHILSMTVLVAATGQAHAVEDGAGMYILGSRTTMGGVVPPPGTYFQQSFYGYSGSNGGEIIHGGRLEFGIDGKAIVALTSMLWVPPSDPVLGGRPYLSLTLPWGYKKSHIDGTLTGPGGGVVSGPVFGSLNLLVNVPIGDYSAARSTNIGFNHWAYDLTGAVTWLGPETGWQANFATGVTFLRAMPSCSV